MSTSANLHLTPQESVDGEMYAMPGASLLHAQIAGNVIRELGNQLRQGPFTVYAANLRVATDAQRHYIYPDVVVAFDPNEYADTHLDTLANPTLIAEILSEETENDDRGAKFERCRAVPTLSAYLLVAQDRVHVELYTRQSNGAWVLREWNDPAEEIELVSLRCRLKIAEIYAKVDFGQSTIAGS